MYLECPVCYEKNDIDTEGMPDNACDNIRFECPGCGSSYDIGWYSEIEVRGEITIKGDDL